jgi:RNA polymerase sigma factor (sigma-70 family)
MGEAEQNTKPEEVGGDVPLEARSALVDRLFREHNRSLMSFLVMRLRSVHEARDVAQEAYVRLLQLDRPGAVSLLRAYLFRTAANLAVDRLRRRAVRDRVATELFEEMAEDETLERTVLARQEFEIVRTAMAALPEKCRRAFVLHVIDGVSTPEVARRMGLSERMVRLHVSRALTECKLRLQERANHEQEEI